MSRADGSGKFWDHVAGHYKEGTSDLMKTLYPDFPSQWSGGQPSVTSPAQPAIEPPKEHDSVLESRINQVGPPRDEPGKEDRGMDRD